MKTTSLGVLAFTTAVFNTASVGSFLMNHQRSSTKFDLRTLDLPMTIASAFEACNFHLGTDIWFEKGASGLAMVHLSKDAFDRAIEMTALWQKRLPNIQFTQVNFERVKNGIFVAEFNRDVFLTALKTAAGIEYRVDRKNVTINGCDAPIWNSTTRSLFELSLKATAENQRAA